MCISATENAPSLDRNGLEPQWLGVCCLQPVPLVCRFGLDQAEETSMEHAEQAPMRTTYHKTFKEKLRPTPSQERALEAVLWRCRELYNAALEQRITAWQRRHISVSRFEQEAELKAIRAEFPEYAAIHSHILQDVLARLDKTYQAFFRRIQRGEGRLPALQRDESFPLLHLQGVR